MEKNNKFLSELLELEVSGKDAISAPGNWLKKTPLLNIKTEVDEIVEDIAPKLISQNGKNKKGVWWFLVGSPGNGKSAAVGSLVRILSENFDSAFREPKDGPHLGANITDIDEHDIPYIVELYEGKNQYSSALLAQDASVVPNPFDKSPNTATSLITLLKDASAHGRSVVVCANRGIIERALQQKSDKSDAWSQALEFIQEEGESKTIKFVKTSGNKLVFDEVEVKVTPLDKKSIISDNTFGKLLDKATDANQWTECDSCAFSPLCPFKNNRDWLATENGKLRFTEVLRYAELMSGQAIVFREALAFIALMLAGTSRDYQNVTTPCAWVHEKVEKGALFSLLSRRIYMLLFSSFSPIGLRHDSQDAKKQLEVLSAHTALLPHSSKIAIKGLSFDKVDKDVGLKRFLSEGRIFSELDPVKENQGKILEQKWNVAVGNIGPIQDNALVTDLEKRCFEIWNDCEKLTDQIPDQDSHSYYRELRRWITSVTYRLGFFEEGKLLFQKELKEYQEILDIDETVDLTEKQEELVYEIEKNFKNFVFGKNPEVIISSVLTVSGRGVRDQLVPKLDLSEGMKTRLIMKIGTHDLELSPRSFAWLKRKSDAKISDKTFPPDVLQVANDIRYKAASYIKYALIPEDIYLKVTKPSGDVLHLHRRNQRLVSAQEE